MTVTASTDEVAAVRAFNRFWTQQIGLLQAGLLDTAYSLTEARVLFELAQGPEPEPTGEGGARAARSEAAGTDSAPRLQGATDLADLRRVLRLDSGYLTRIVGRFRDAGLVTSERSPDDGRRQVIRLTERGRSEFRALDQRSNDAIARLLGGLADGERHRLVMAMQAIQRATGTAPAERPRAYVLREPGHGELGWIVARHGALYAAEHGWDQTFEAMVARIVADYGEHRDPARERAWIAELDGEPVGCVMCVRYDDETAQLRVLLVDPAARGLGIGARLVDECVRFARGAGYRSMVLWTNSVLVSARRIYEAAGFRLVDEGPHDRYGHDVVDQEWRLDL